MDENKGSSILIVDDVPANLNLLTGILKQHGYKVRPAPSGSLALEAARYAPPDLILLDIHMPEMDGFEVCRRLKADAPTRNIPILMLSAKAQTNEIKEGLEAGADKYLCKPISFPELLREVRAYDGLPAEEH